MKLLRIGKSKVKKVFANLMPVRFGNNPRNLRVKRPIYIRGSTRIFFGDDVQIGPNAFLKAITNSYSEENSTVEFQARRSGNPTIVIGNRVSATSGLHIAALDRVVIEDDVMFASNVFMADSTHGYAHADIPFKYQGMTESAPIAVRFGCWIGQNVVIMPGVTVGPLSIIGANSVVTRSIPARCIAAGSPARIIKRWNETERAWVREIQDYGDDSSPRPTTLTRWSEDDEREPNLRE